ncbi:MAG: aspartyl-tRNA amidotransferase subunit B [Bellilinea sp.]|nr:MAG: aspartyl-tRNA amidotransferase subunit B [Bellilinea sp.]
MELKKHIENSLKDAMRSGDETRKRTLRLIIASIKNAEIEKGSALDDSGIMGIIHKEVKIRKEALEGAEQANREDLKEMTLAEIKILEEFLPKPLDESELRQLIKVAIEETQAKSPGDTGKVMKFLMPKVQGRASGDQVSRLVREFLSQ